MAKASLAGRNWKQVEGVARKRTPRRVTSTAWWTWPATTAHLRRVVEDVEEPPGVAQSEFIEPAAADRQRKVMKCQQYGPVGLRVQRVLQPIEFAIAEPPAVIARRKAVEQDHAPGAGALLAVAREGR